MIVQGVLEPDEKLPSVRELATSLTINPNTIQRAYRELEQAGYIYSVKGRGSFVAGVPEEMDGRKKELFDQLVGAAKELSYLGVLKKQIMNKIEENLGDAK